MLDSSLKLQTPTSRYLCPFRWCDFSLHNDGDRGDNASGPNDGRIIVRNETKTGKIGLAAGLGCDTEESLLTRTKNTMLDDLCPPPKIHNKTEMTFQHKRHHTHTHT